MSDTVFPEPGLSTSVRYSYNLDSVLRHFPVDQ
jgi:hypothetical protein